MEKERSIKIAVIGAESTGKTRLCEALALHYGAAVVPEYARLYFEKHNINHYSLQELEHIATKQSATEKEIAQQNPPLIFCDTAIVTIKIWATLEFRHCPESIEHLMETNRYDFYLLTQNDIPWVADEQRQNKFSRDQIFALNRDAVINSNTPYAVVSGINHERANNAIAIIDAFLQKKGSVIK